MWKEIRELLVFLWPLIVLIVGPIISAIVCEALKASTGRRRWGGILGCAAAFGAVLFIFVFPRPLGPQLVFDRQPEKTDGSLVFYGRVLRHNPYRVVAYLEKLSEPGNLYITSPDGPLPTSPISSEGTWMIKLTPTEDMKTIYFFLVREMYPAPIHAPGPQSISSFHYVKWGIVE